MTEGGNIGHRHVIGGDHRSLACQVGVDRVFMLSPLGLLAPVGKVSLLIRLLRFFGALLTIMLLSAFGGR
jgi:hypothetical protein